MVYAFTGCCRSDRLDLSSERFGLEIHLAAHLVRVLVVKLQHVHLAFIVL